MNCNFEIRSYSPVSMVIALLCREGIQYFKQLTYGLPTRSMFLSFPQLISVFVLNCSSNYVVDLDAVILFPATCLIIHGINVIMSTCYLVVLLQVGNHSKYQNTRCFVLIRSDGTTEDFSYHKCVLGALEIIAPHRVKGYQSKWMQEKFE